MDDQGLPYCVIEPDAAKAAELKTDGVSVVMGDVDSSATYEAVHAAESRLVVANLGDAVNTNITLTVREAGGATFRSRPLPRTRTRSMSWS